MEVKAFSPGHITGFFTINDTPSSLLYKGSLGAGVSLSIGVTKTVNVVKADKKGIFVYINGEMTDKAVVSERVVDLFFQITHLSADCHITIKHLIAVPVGAGCGSSGAGALSLAYCLNEVFSAGLSSISCAQIAHQAEVEMKTGLGTVIGETFGGVEVRVKPGAPGIGEIIHIPQEEKSMVFILMFGPLSTKDFLGNEEIREKVNHYGRSLVQKIVLKPTIDNFLAFSRQFTEKTGLITPEVSRVMSVCDKHGFIMSMPMFGNGVFTLTTEEKTGTLYSLLDKQRKNATLIMSEIDNKGVRIVYGD